MGGGFSFTSFTLKKLECLKQACFVLNILAWDNGIGPPPVSLVYSGEVMINRDSWGSLYFVARGEILGLLKDKRVRKLSTRMFSLIKNES
jgi:hypothetical protein